MIKLFETIGETCIINYINKPNNSIQHECGAIYIIFLSSDLTPINYTRISHNVNSGIYLQAQAAFGGSLANIGDLDNDGINELAVGSPGLFVSQIFVLYLFRNGSVRNHVIIRGEFVGFTNVPSYLNYTNPNIDFIPNGPTINYNSRFGIGVTNIGDFNNDGVNDIAVTSASEASGVSYIYIILLNKNAKVLNYTQISYREFQLEKNFTYFGISVTSLGDIDNDGKFSLFCYTLNLILCTLQYRCNRYCSWSQEY